MWEPKEEKSTKSKEDEEKSEATGGSIHDFLSEKIKAGACSKEEAERIVKLVDGSVLELKDMLASGPLIIGEDHHKPDARAVIYQLMQLGAVDFFSIEMVYPWTSMLKPNGSINLNLSDKDVMYVLCKCVNEEQSSFIRVRDLLTKAASKNIEVYFHDMPADEVYSPGYYIDEIETDTIETMDVDASVIKAKSFMHGPYFTKPELRKEVIDNTHYLAERNAYASNVLKDRFKDQLPKTRKLLILCGAGHIAKAYPEDKDLKDVSLDVLMKIDGQRVRSFR